MYKALKIENNETYYSVQLKRSQDQLLYWIDIEVSDGDVEADWNQFIFYDKNEEDVHRANVQMEPEEFDEATDEAVRALVEKDILVYKNNTWYLKK